MQFGKRVLAATVLASLAVGGVAATAGASAGARANVVSPKVTTPTNIDASVTSTADTSGDQYVFWKGNDGNLWATFENGSTHVWNTGATSLGYGPLGSEPSVAIDQTDGMVGPTYLYVMWEGSDSNLWMAVGTIAAPTSAPDTISWQVGATSIGQGPLGSAPSVVFNSDTANANTGVDGLWAFWKGSDGNLWTVHDATYTPSTGATTWPTSPTVIPGMATLGSAPSAGSDAAGDVYVYWQGSGNNTHVWEAWYNNTAATPVWTTSPIDLGGITGNTGSPASLTVLPAGQQYLFWQGMDGNLYFAEWTGAYTGGGGWLNNLYNYIGDGPLNSQPSASSFGDTATVGGIDVYWKGQDLNLWSTNDLWSAGFNSTWATVVSLGYGPLDGATAA